MTEMDWLESCDSAQMIEFLGNRTGRSRLAKQMTKLECVRKQRLFSVACCNQAASHFVDKRSLQAINTCERFADGLATREEMERARTEAKAAYSELSRSGIERAKIFAAFASCELTDLTFRQSFSLCIYVADNCLLALGNPLPNPQLATRNQAERQIQAGLLRDIFGNPFRPRAVTLDPRWLTSTVIDLARTIYDERQFERMPILADALMDAGCDSEEVIKHCQGPGPHVRGCWVVDLLLGKS